MSQAASFSPALPDDPPPIIGEPPRLTRKLDKWRFRPWFRHGEFSTDWATSHFWVWRRVLAPAARPRRAGPRDRIVGRPLRDLLPELPSRLQNRLHRHVRRRGRASDRRAVRCGGASDRAAVRPQPRCVCRTRREDDKRVRSGVAAARGRTAAVRPRLHRRQPPARRRDGGFQSRMAIGAARRHRDLGRLHMVAGRAAGATAAAGDRRISRRHEEHYRLLAKGLQVIVRKLS
jgi:hypothetical protein